MNRDDRQAENIENWKDVGCKGTLEACTGYGKTRVALKAIKRLNKKHNIKTLVVVPTNYLQEQWQERIKKFSLSGGIQVKTIQSILRSYKTFGDGEKCTLLIPDEVHKYTADQFGKLYDIIDYSMVLGLTATIPEDDEKREFIEQYAPVFDTVDLAEAKKNDWVSDFIVYQLGIELDPEERMRYDKLTDKFYSNFSWFNNDFDKVTRTLNNDKFCKKWAKKQQLRNKDGSLATGRLKGHASRVMGTIQKRKTLLYNSDSKLKVLKEILEKFPDKLAICFSQRTDFADKVAEEFPERAFAYHSNIEGDNINGEYYGVERMKEWGIDQFADSSSDINILSTARALDMGADIPAMDLGIITSASSKSLQAIQRIGRVIRYEEDKVAIIVDIFAKDTQDEWWLRNRYDDFPSSSIRRISNIEDIKHL